MNNKLSLHSEMHLSSLEQLRELADAASSGKRYTLQHKLSKREYSGTLEELAKFFLFEDTSEITKLVATGNSNELRLRLWKVV